MENETREQTAKQLMDLVFEDNLKRHVNHDCSHENCPLKGRCVSCDKVWPCSMVRAVKVLKVYCEDF